jgi:hypothetical protein
MFFEFPDAAKRKWKVGWSQQPRLLIFGLQI